MSERRTLIDSAVPGAPASERRPSLIVLAGRDFGRQYFLAKEETSIGRDEDCTIRLSDARISRKHSKIVRESGGASGAYYKLVDLSSTNGTFLNNQKIKEALLSEGDCIRVGYTVLKYAIRDIVEIEYEKKIFRMATTDALTKLYTREYFLQQYSDLFHRCERYQRPFSLVMIDIDDFKSVNDRFGHQMGDRVLDRIGRAILDVIRHEDVAARYGGEEFAILLPETEPPKAHIPAERLRRNIKAMKITTGEKEISVTVSIGIAGYPEHAPSMDELIEAADKALYAAKESGKDATHIFIPAP